MRRRCYSPCRGERPDGTFAPRRPLSQFSVFEIVRCIPESRMFYCRADATRGGPTEVRDLHRFLRG